MAQDNPWKEINLEDVDFIKQVWPCLTSEELQDNVEKDSPIYKKVCPWPCEVHV
jgi:hypothetical protein